MLPDFSIATESIIDVSSITSESENPEYELRLHKDSPSPTPIINSDITAMAIMPLLSDAVYGCLDILERITYG